MIEAVPELPQLLKKNFKIENSGTANRLGRQYGNLHGKRVGPYELRMQLAGTDSQEWPWKLVIETEIEILDPAGQPIEALDPVATNLKLIERNPRVSIVAPVLHSEKKNQAASAEQTAQISHAEERTLMVMRAFKPESFDLTTKTVELDEGTTTVKRFERSGDVKKLDLVMASDQESAWRMEAFFSLDIPRGILISRVHSSGERVPPSEQTATAWLLFSDLEGTPVSGRSNVGQTAQMGPRGWSNFAIDPEPAQRLTQAIQSLAASQAPTPAAIDEVISSWKQHRLP